MLYVASILVGLAHGAHWTLMVATSSELFGLQNFGALYNTLRFASLYPIMHVKPMSCPCSLSAEWLLNSPKCLPISAGPVTRFCLYGLEIVQNVLKFRGPMSVTTLRFIEEFMWPLTHLLHLYVSSISSTMGSYILSVKLAGYLYDRQVAAAQAIALATGQEVSRSHKCAGPDCFRSTFLVMACVCGLGCVALIRLTARTRKVYHNLYKLQQGKDAPGGSLESKDSLPLLSKDSSSEEGVLSDNTVYTAHTVSDPHLRHSTPTRA